MLQNWHGHEHGLTCIADVSGLGTYLNSSINFGCNQSASSHLDFNVIVISNSWNLCKLLEEATVHIEV